ncbi:MAG: alpha/beta hydrolase [Anaerolineae bacterium]|nr:alpha/beta hydrolase [Anaerolineae bacterium]
MINPSVFKTAEGAAAYQTAYDAVLSLWPVPHQPLDVPTSYGTTHFNCAGDPNHPPLLLLHGAAVTSTEWYANVGALSHHFRVYAPDVVNQMGLSVSTHPLQTRQDCAAWLIELLAALKLEKATIIGHSLGGWLALNLAVSAPDRVERLLLLSPAASFASVSWRFLLRFLLAVFVPTHKNIHRFIQSTTTMPLDERHVLIEQLMMGIKHFKPQQMGTPIFSVFKDDELRQLTMPTLLLIGEHEIIYKPTVVFERARRLLPHLEAELIMGGGHLFPIDQADATNARLLKFLGVTQ